MAPPGECESQASFWRPLAPSGSVLSRSLQLRLGPGTRAGRHLPHARLGAQVFLPTPCLAEVSRGAPEQGSSAGARRLEDSRGEPRAPRDSPEPAQPGRGRDAPSRRRALGAPGPTGAVTLGQPASRTHRSLSGLLGFKRLGRAGGGTMRTAGADVRARQHAPGRAPVTATTGPPSGLAGSARGQADPGAGVSAASGKPSPSLCGTHPHPGRGAQRPPSLRLDRWLRWTLPPKGPRPPRQQRGHSADAEPGRSPSRPSPGRSSSARARRQARAEGKRLSLRGADSPPAARPALGQTEGRALARRQETPLARDPAFPPAPPLLGQGAG